MSRRRSLERHRRSLTEIRDIMNSMKTLAHLEIRKLERFLSAQRAVVRSIEEVATDFLGFHPETLPEAISVNEVYLMVGTERGFCGDFNQALLKHLESSLEAQSSGPPTLIVIGRKLHTLVEEDERVSARIDGTSVAEEVDSLLSRIVSELATLQTKCGVITLYAVYHGGENGVVMHRLLPPFQQCLHLPPGFPHPPVLNLAPADFLIELTDHYLFAALHEVVYASLMAENRRRMTHLEGAVRHLDDESAELARRCNTLRQEEIIEEIEVILLSAAGVAEQ
jgi:F-type H+-transporting ATPase subunit gamma